MQDETQAVNALNAETPAVEVIQDSVSSTEEQPQAAESHPQDKKLDELPEYAKERLGIQKKRYEKQIASMQRQIDALSQSVPQQRQASQPQGLVNPLTGEPIEPGSVQEQVIATLATLAQKKAQDEEALRMQQMNDEIRRDAAKYDDFDDVVYDPETPFTVPVAQAAYELPNTADVLYNLGKDRKELNRIANLRPIDMKRELVKLSVGLLNKKSVVQETPKAPKPLETLKSNPLTKTTPGITAKSSVSEIRAYLKQRK